MIPSSKKFPVPLILVDRISSTNSYLYDHCREKRIASFTTVQANYQTTGRGQRGSHWESEEGRNLLFSFILFPDFLEARRQFVLSQIISLSIKEVLDTCTTGISIKWPNDIYWQERKICGILIEHELMGNRISQSIAGIGLNINQQTFSSSLPNPVSLWQITHKEYDCLELLAQIMNRIKEYHNLLLQGNTEMIATRYQQALFRNNGMYPYTDSKGKFLAEIASVEPGGALVLRDRTGKERAYNFKEVQYVI